MTGLSQLNTYYINGAQESAAPNYATPAAGTEAPKSPGIAEDAGKDSSKKLKLALGALAVAGVAALAIGAGVKHKFNIDDAKRFFDKTNTGNNKVIEGSVNETKTAADKFMTEHADICGRIKEYIASVVEPRKLDEIASDGVVYHGTSVETTKSILQDGITPYASKTASNQVPGLGRGVYTTPTLDLARHYSEGGVILPYKIEGQIGELNVDIDEFRSVVAGLISEGLEPNAKSTAFLGKQYTIETINTATEYTADVINRIMKDSGYAGLYSPKGMTTGLMSGIFGNLPENIDTAGQLAVYDGTRLILDVEKLKELNPITKDNYHKFLKK